MIGTALLDPELCSGSHWHIEVDQHKKVIFEPEDAEGSTLKAERSKLKARR
jgi:hypothetical protein